jgi:ATP-dependent Lon protease
LQVAKIKILHFLATTSILFREGVKMLKVSFDETKRKEIAAAKIKKLSLDAVGAHQLFDAKNLTSLTFGLNEETRSQLLRLDESGPLRRLMIVPNDYLERCRQLEVRFPNFSGYINDYLLPSLALAHVRKASLQLPPTVFVGSPGVGKTLFVSALAETFYLDFERVNLETSQASLELVGTARGWANAQPGLLFRWMIRSEFANGILVMEELDKADNKDSRNPIINSLLQLLEPTTSKSFGDLSMPDLKLDLSKINFLFTANTLDGIPPAVLSRVMAFEVPDLTPTQAKNIALRQYQEMLQDLNLPISAPILTQEGLALLASESPRRQRLLLQLAIGSAVYKEAKELVIQKTSKPPKGIGFVI